MKHFFTLLILLPLGAIAQTTVLGTAIPVADDNMYGKTRPRIVLAENNVPVVMWGKKTANKVHVSRFSSGSFNTPVLVTTGSTEAFVTDWAGPDVAAMGDDVFVTFHSQPEETGFVYVVKSADGAMTFGDTVRAENIGADQSRFPAIAVDANGDPSVMFMRFTGNWIDPQYVVASSNNGGMSYGADANASELAPGEVCDCCPAGIINEGQRKIAMFRNNDSNLRDLWVTVSDDNGASFDIGNDVDPNDWMINACPSTGPDGHVDGDSLYTVWMSAGQGVARIYLSSVHLPMAMRGETWEVAPDQSGSANQNYPRIAGDGQIMGIVYQSSSGGNTDCYMVVSTNGGADLSAPFLIHSSTDGMQRSPDVIFADGVFHVVYEDMAEGSLIYNTVSLVGTGIRDRTEYAYSTWVDEAAVLHVSGLPEGHKTIELINSLGQMLNSTSITGESFTSEVLKAGAYLVRVSIDNKQQTRKVIVR